MKIPKVGTPEYMDYIADTHYFAAAVLERAQRAIAHKPDVDAQVTLQTLIDKAIKIGEEYLKKEVDLVMSKDRKRESKRCWPFRRKHTSRRRSSG